MTMLTDEIRSFRQMFDGYEQTGVKIDGRGVSTLRARLNTMLALAGELEEEVSHTQWNRLGEPLDQDTVGGNVVMLVPQDAETELCRRCGHATHKQEAACLNCGKLKPWAQENAP